METAYIYCEWFHMTPRNDVAVMPICHLLSYESGYYEGIMSNITTTFEKSYITGYFTGEEFEEKLKIRKHVQDILLTTSKQIAEGPDTLFSFTPILSGSSAEGAKVGYPDEFDFLLKMDNFSHVFNSCNFLKNTDLLTDITQSDNSKVNIVWKITEFKNIINKTLKMPILPCGFKIERFIPHSSRIKPFTFVLQWNGEHFKDLTISIDAVPAFECDVNKLKHSPTLYKADGYPIYVIPNCVGHFDTDLRLSFSAHELGHIKTYPSYVMHAYCLAKATRHNEICPSVDTGDGYTSVFDHISSYMVKTCLLHLMDDDLLVKQLPASELRHDLLCPFSIAMAVKIYQKMQYFIVQHKGKVPIFFHRNSDACSRYQMEMQRGEEEEKMLAKNIKIVLFFIRTMKKILVNNVTSSCQLNCQWGTYHTGTVFMAY